MSETTTSIVTTKTHGDVAVITMDDGKANALSPTMLTQLGAAFDGAESAKAVVLAGRPGRFCAGFDLRIMMSGPAAAKALVVEGGELLMRLYELPTPLVIACTGHALAGGVLLVATGDTRIGINGDFKLGLNEVQKGMPVPILAHEMARDRLVPGELFASVVQAKIYDPTEAVTAGWLDRSVDPAELEAVALAEAARLATLPSHAYAMSKRSLRRQTIEFIRESMDRNIAEMTGGM